MYGLFTPLINRLGLSQMLVCPGHTHENWCAGGALALARLPDKGTGTAWFSTRRLSFQPGPSSVTVAFTHSSIKHLKPLEAGSTGRGPECCPQTHPSLQSYFQRC